MLITKLLSNNLREIFFLIFPFSLIDFCVNEILNISKCKLKIMVPFMIWCVFVKMVFLFELYFSFFYQTTEASCQHFLNWKKLLMACRSILLNSNTCSLTNLSESFFSQSKESMALVIRLLVGLSYFQTAYS